MSASIDKVAWICIRDGRVLCARSKGKPAFYLPGGKREPGETDADTLVREIEEELTARIRRESVEYAGMYEAQADGKPDGVIVRMTCYFAEHDGDIRPASEIDEIAWLAYEDRPQLSEAGRLVFDELRAAGRLKER
ncbi:NUDIX domain-containing protein [Paenibacillus sp.]|uniref:NUDIX hydrolase n=1 Tax=Paenibacillus sp. TaxID=58172 RepID=UPI002D5EE287|nr:NUDIX domain-containing protein [Paenibacillus sp.]HZG86859.1 NUDIX domain-containing protein [Paenibacillus sp.]